MSVMPSDTSRVHLVKDVQPVMVHSHNDEGRAVPLWEALQVGCACIEPDIILHKGIIHVGHDRDELRPNKTLKSMYLDPLLSLLEELYPNSDASKRRSVYPAAPDFSLILNLDFKYAEPGNLPALLSDLEELNSKGYLSTVSEGKLKRSSITLCATGSYPTQDILALEPRHIFLDAPLGNLTGPVPWSNLTSPLASGDASKLGYGYVGLMANSKSMQAVVKEAHDKGITARFWGMPAYPRQLRHRAWSAALKSGADWLNADNLEEAAAFMRKHEHDEL